MKKIFILLLFCLVLSGCTVEYDLSYYDNVYTEDMNLIVKDGELCGNVLCYEDLNNFYNTNISVNYNDNDEEIAEGINLDKYSFYNKSLDNYKMSMNYSHDKESDYSNSRMVHSLFNKFYVNEYRIQASDIVNVFNIYPNLENIVISFKTDKYLSNINCDEEKNGVYYWYINKNNYLDKTIDIEFDYESNLNVSIMEDGYFNKNIIKYVLMFLLIIVLFGIIVIYDKVKKSND